MGTIDEKAQYVDLRDTTASLVSALHAAGHHDDGSQLAATYKRWRDAYWEMNRSGGSGLELLAWMRDQRDAARDAIGER